MFSKTAKFLTTATVDAKTGCPADGGYRQGTATSRNGRVIFKAVTPLAATAALALGLVLSAGAVILTAGPAQAFHKGVVHGGGEMPGESIQTLNSLACAAGEIAKWTGTVWECAVDKDTAPTTSDVEGLGFVTDANTVDFDTLDDLDCTTGQIAKFDGVDWDCDGAPKTVFVTSSGEWNGDLMTAGNGIDGLSGADNLCQAAANRTNNVPAGNYIAWLSDSVTDAGDRLPANTVGYILPDGTKVADDKADLLDGDLDHAIDQNEFGDAHYVAQRFVWTSSDSDGTGLADTCDDWTNAGGSGFNARIIVVAEPNVFTLVPSNQLQSCAADFIALICFQK